MSIVLLTNVKALVAPGRERRAVEAGHPREGRPLPEPRLQVVQSLVRPFGHDFDGAVRAVAGKPAHAQRLGLLQDEVPIADPLDTPLHDEAKRGHLSLPRGGSLPPRPPPQPCTRSPPPGLPPHSS